MKVPIQNSLPPFTIYFSLKVSSRNSSQIWIHFQRVRRGRRGCKHPSDGSVLIIKLFKSRNKHHFYSALILLHSDLYCRSVFTCASYLSSLPRCLSADFKDNVNGSRLCVREKEILHFYTKTTFLTQNLLRHVLPFLTSLHTVILQVRIFLDKKKTAQNALLGYIFKIRAPKLQNFKNRQNNSYLCKYVSDLIVLLYCFYLFCSFIARQILLISDIQILCSDIQVPQSELK